MPCPQCSEKDVYIAALEKVNKALRIALDNGKASLEAQGRCIRKAEAEAKAAKQILEHKTQETK